MKISPEFFYRYAPLGVQNFLISIAGYAIKRRRYNRDFHRCFDAVQHRDLCSKDAIRTYQENRLRFFLERSRTVPYWLEQFERYDIDLSAASMVNELSKLPVIDKTTVKDNVSRLLNPSFRKSQLLPAHTSGTTGSGLQFFETRAAEHEQWAIWWRYRTWHKIPFEAICGYFGGRSIVPIITNKEPFWRTNYFGNQIMFSAYHLNAVNAPLYFEHLRKNKVPWLHGYPSVIALLAGYMLEHKAAPLESLKIITIGAESLLDNQREIIQKAFRVPVRQHYGLREAAANISECEFGKLHVDEDFSFVEFIPVKGMEGYYHIIGTNWSNEAFPLFRYDTGDICRFEDKTCACGRKTRTVADLDGRKEDYVCLPNGVKIGRLDHIFKDMVSVREAQIYQYKRGSIEIRVVKGEGFQDDKETRLLLNETRQRLGNEIGISIRFVPHIERTKSGKLRFVISEIR